MHTRQQNKYQVSHKHSCISWWWAHSSLKHVEIDKYKYTKEKKNMCTKLVYLQDNETSHIHIKCITAMSVPVLWRT